MKIKLKQAFDLQMGKTPARNQAENWGGNHRWVSIADIGNAEKYIAKTKECITDAGINASGIKVVPQGTVIMSFKLSIGKTAITAQDMYTNEAIIAFIDKKIFEIDPNYLYHLCCGTDWTAGTNKAVMGLTLNKATLLEKEISLPDICQQRKIAAKLDKIDAIIADRQQQLTMIEQAVKSRFVEMFGNPRINPNKYPTKLIKDTCIVITGNTPSRKVHEYYGDAIEWIKTDNIVSSLLYPTVASESLSDSGKAVGRAVDAGAILMACIAGSVASIGRVCITDREVAFNQQINAIVPKEYDVRFLHALLQISKDYLVEDINMSLKGIISKSKLEEKEFIVPSMEEQVGFADFVKQIDKSKYYSQKFLTLCRLAVNIYEQEWMKCQTLNF